MNESLIPPLSGPWGSPQDLQSRPTMLRRNRLGTSQLVPGAAPPWVFDYSRFCDPIESSITVSLAAPMGAPFIQRGDTPRNWLFFRNTDTTNIVFISYGGPASTLSPLAINPGERVLLDYGVPQSDVWAAVNAGTAVLSFGFSSMGTPP